METCALVQVLLMYSFYRLGVIHQKYMECFLYNTTTALDISE